MGTRMEEEFVKRSEKGKIRLNKYLSEAGICSRREADRMIEAGKVTVDGRRAMSGMRVSEGQRILVDGKAVEREKKMVLLAVNKPVGVVCTTDTRWGDVTVDQLLHYPKRIFYVGRLDKDSEGLLLMTNNGDILNKIMRAGNYHEKEYEVTVDKELTEDFLKRMAEGGIPILDQVTRPCRVKKLGKKRFRIILTQGMNRQIRRMCEYLGYRVVRLIRVRIMNIRLEKLRPGEYREVTAKEQERLYEMLKTSRNHIEYERK